MKQQNIWSSYFKHWTVIIIRALYLKEENLSRWSHDSSSSLPRDHFPVSQHREPEFKPSWKQLKWLELIYYYIIYYINIIVILILYKWICDACIIFRIYINFMYFLWYEMVHDSHVLILNYTLYKIELLFVPNDILYFQYNINTCSDFDYACLIWLLCYL